MAARSVADSAFLSRIGPAQLPSVLLLSAIFVTLTGVLYSFLLRLGDHQRVVLRTLLALCLCSAILPLLMRAFPSSYGVFAFVYVLAQIRGSLGTIQYVTLLNEHLTNRGLERAVC